MIGQLRDAKNPVLTAGSRRVRHRDRLLLEELEARTVLSVVAPAHVGHVDAPQRFGMSEFGGREVGAATSRGEASEASSGGSPATAQFGRGSESVDRVLAKPRSLFDPPIRDGGLPVDAGRTAEAGHERQPTFSPSDRMPTSGHAVPRHEPSRFDSYLEPSESVLISTPPTTRRFGPGSQADAFPAQPSFDVEPREAGLDNLVEQPGNPVANFETGRGDLAALAPLPAAFHRLPNPVEESVRVPEPDRLFQRGAEANDGRDIRPEPVSSFESITASRPPVTPSLPPEATTTTTIAASSRSAVIAPVSAEQGSTAEQSSVASQANVDAQAIATQIVVAADDRSAATQVTVAVLAVAGESAEATRVIQARAVDSAAESRAARVQFLAQWRGGSADFRPSAVELDTGQAVSRTAQQHSNPTRLAAQAGVALAETVADAGARLEGILTAAPIVCDLVTTVAAIDLPALDETVQRIVDQLETLSDEVADTLHGVRVTTWLTVFAVSAAVFEGVRLLVRRTRGQPGLAVGPGGEPSSWPDSVGRPPEDLR